MAVVIHSYGGLGVDRNGVGEQQVNTGGGGLGCMSRDTGAHSVCEVKTLTPDLTTCQVRRFEQGQAGICRSSGEGLNMRRHRFVVHAAGWLHSMVHHGRTPC